MTPETLVRMLADETRLRVFAALALGAADAAAAARAAGTGPRETAVALHRLTEAGLVVDAAGTLRVPVDELRELARASTPAEPERHGHPDGRAEAVLRTFVRQGRLVRLPAQRGRRRVVLEHIVDHSFEPEVRYPERVINERLRRWCDGGAADHVSLRRYLIDELLLERADGVYWRPGR